MKLCLQCNQYFEETVESCPNDSSRLESVGKDPLIGALINDRYVVESVIGKGSSGIVYKARRLLMGREVAVKVLHSYLRADGSALDRFLREARAASRLRHPHIITLWESGVTDDGQPYFVMDYLEGMTLADLIREKGAIHPMRALPIIRQVCEALTEAHKLGIVHRDIKPENIVLQETDYADDYVKVLDFSIADLPHESKASSQSLKGKTAAGSPAYMSAEQCQGLELDARSDIYSLAVVIFELLTGKRPFSADNLRDLMLMHVAEEPPALSAVRTDLQFPPALEVVLSKALAKSPEERQQSIKEFWKELEEAAGGFDSLDLTIKPKKDSVPVEDFSIPASDRLTDSSVVAKDTEATLDRFGPVPEADLNQEQDNETEDHNVSHAVKRLLEAAKRSSNTDNGKKEIHKDLLDLATSENRAVSDLLQANLVSVHESGAEVPVPVSDREIRPDQTNTTNQSQTIVDKLPYVPSAKDALGFQVQSELEQQSMTRAKDDAKTFDPETNAQLNSLPATASRLIEAAQRNVKSAKQGDAFGIEVTQPADIFQQSAASIQKEHAIEHGTGVQERISQNMSSFFEAVQRGSDDPIWPVSTKTSGARAPTKPAQPLTVREEKKRPVVKQNLNEQSILGQDVSGTTTDQTRQEALSEAVKRLTDPGSQNIKAILEREALMRAHNVLSQVGQNKETSSIKLSEGKNEYLSGYKMPEPKNLGEKVQLQRQSRQAVRELFKDSRVKPISVIVPSLAVIAALGLVFWIVFEMKAPRQTLPSPDMLIQEGRIEEALVALEHEQEIGKLKPSDLDKLNNLYVTLAKKYSQQNKYHEAVTLIERLPKKLRTADIEALAKRWKKLAKKPVETE